MSFPATIRRSFKGSALKALESDDPDSAEAKPIFELLDAVDSWIPAARAGH